MKYIPIIMTIAMLAISAIADNGSEAVSHNQWLDSCYAEILTIKPGMERKDLDALFTPDGGVAFRQSQTFLYKKAHIIKIHVTFHIPAADSTGPFAPHDLIESISFPFLEYPN